MQGLVEFVKTLGATRVLAMAAVAAALIGFFAFLILRVTAVPMTPLFTDLTFEDSAAIIRDLERRMQEEKDWLRKPKPSVAKITFGKEQGLDPDKTGLDYRRYQRLMFDVIALALQTDSTRVRAWLPVANER